MPGAISPLRVALVASAVVALAAACSNDTDQASFVDHMISTMADPPGDADRAGWEETYACTYRRLSAEDVESLMALGGDEWPDRDLSARVSKVLVECRGGPPTTTTPTSATVPPTAAPAP